MARDDPAASPSIEICTIPTSSPPLHNDIHSPDQQDRSTNVFQHLEHGTASRSRADYTFPEGGLRAWLVVAGSFAVISGTFGLLSSLGLFQSYWQEHQLSSYKPRDVGWIAAVNIFMNLFLGVQIGPLFDRYGSRGLMAIGSVVYVVSLVLLAQCRLYWHFMLVYGILAGSSGAFLTTTALAVVAHWFERKRGLASGIAFVGSSVGGICFPLILKPAFEYLTWAWSIRLIALIVLVQMTIGNFCIRGRLPPRENGGAVDLKCFLDARFSWTTIGVSCKCHTSERVPIQVIELDRSPICIILNQAGFEFVLFGVLGLLPAYALRQGFSNQTAFNIIAILNAGSAFGRSFSGYISDRYGRFNTVIVTLAWSMVVTFALWLPVGIHIVPFYIFAPLFGFGSGSIISMAPVCLGQLCQADQYGQFYGTSYSVVAFANMLCIPLGGELLPLIGPIGFVAFFGGILVLSLASFLMARWACLDYHWKWNVKI